MLSNYREIAKKKDRLKRLSFRANFLSWINATKSLLFLQLLLGAFFFGCAESVKREPNPRILAMGDSLLAWNKVSGRSITNIVEKSLSESVVDRSVIGARMIYNLPISGAMGLSIGSQYRPGNWEWIILSGGGNDLWFGCGCNRCDRMIDRLISKNGQSGSIPKLISKLRKPGARVIYVGYLRSPGVNSLIETCKSEGDELERRVANYASNSDGVYYLSLTRMVPDGDRSYHAFDMIHPSVKASAAIGELVAATIRSLGKP